MGAKLPTGAAAQTRHMFFGQWHTMGIGGRNANPDKCEVPSGMGGSVGGKCKFERTTMGVWGGGMTTFDYRTVVKAWCNDWGGDKAKCCAANPSQPGCCSGFMYGHLYGISKSLAT